MKKVILTLSILILLSLNAISAEKTILIDKYHDTDNWWGDPEGTGKFLFTELSTLGFKTKINESPLTAETLRGSDILVLWNPNNALEENEISALTKFVDDGGSVLILASHEQDMLAQSRDSLNTFLEPFGIRIMKNGTDDPSNRKGCSCTPIIHNFIQHPTTEGIESILMYKPASLEIKGNAIAIAKGDNDTFSVGTEPVGGENVVVVAVSEKGNGKVAVMGSPYIFDNGKLGEMQNKEFSRTLFTWLSDTSSAPMWPYYLLGVIVLFFGYLIYLKKIRK